MVSRSFCNYDTIVIMIMIVVMVVVVVMIIIMIMIIIIIMIIISIVTIVLIVVVIMIMIMIMIIIFFFIFWGAFVLSEVQGLRLQCSPLIWHRLAPLPLPDPKPSFCVLFGLVWSSLFGASSRLEGPRWPQQQKSPMRFGKVHGTRGVLQRNYGGIGRGDLVSAFSSLARFGLLGLGRTIRSTLSGLRWRRVLAYCRGQKK